MTHIDTYKGLDRDSKMEISLSMPEVAEHICQLNYGAHRLLSAMVHELRKRQFDYIQCLEIENASKPEERRLKISSGDERSPLADAISAALNAGHTH